MPPGDGENLIPYNPMMFPPLENWSEEEIDVTGECLREYVKDLPVVAHVAGGYRETCERYLENAVYTCKDGKTTSPESMHNLKTALKSYSKIRNKNKNLKKLRSIARYQFNGKDADSLIPDGSWITGRFNRRIIHGGKQIATLLYETGLYSLNLEGGRILRDLEKSWVEIDFDLKTNTLFAPGVVDAHPDILPGDEVVILRQTDVVGVGKTVLSGKEMKKAVKGVAVRVRHRIMD